MAAALRAGADFLAAGLDAALRAGVAFLAAGLDAALRAGVAFLAAGLDAALRAGAAFFATGLAAALRAGAAFLAAGLDAAFRAGAAFLAAGFAAAFRAGAAFLAAGFAAVAGRRGLRPRSSMGVEATDSNNLSYGALSLPSDATQEVRTRNFSFLPGRPTVSIFFSVFRSRKAAFKTLALAFFSRSAGMLFNTIASRTSSE